MNYWKRKTLTLSVFKYSSDIFQFEYKLLNVSISVYSILMLLTTYLGILTVSVYSSEYSVLNMSTYI